jgi:hypothetical protein
MTEPLFINELIAEIEKGSIRIPSFQRGFVWDGERVAKLMDSIYKGYPFGTILVWRTKTPLKSERLLGPFELPENDPEYPLDYVLDGQQRITSIFGVFQTKLEATPEIDNSIFNIYYDLESHEDAQGSNFIYLEDQDVDPKKHFPLKILFNPPEYRKFLRDMDESIATQVDTLYDRFTKARIPVQTFKTDDRATVAIVFERINRLGVKLDTLQLLSAWTWSEDFDLQEKFRELTEELSPFGFDEVGEDNDLLLRCCSAIIDNSTTPETIINLDGTIVRNSFSRIRNGILGAIDYLKTNLNVYSTQILPFKNIIIPLSVFFATDKEQGVVPNANQHKALLKWIWRAFFSKRYSKSLDKLNQDILEIVKLRKEEQNYLGDFEVKVDKSFFTTNTFNTNYVNSKTFILLLADEDPLNFTDGSVVSLESVLRNCNKKEFHHIYPQGYLKTQKRDSKLINCLANFCIISRGPNNKLKGDKPSIYRQHMPKDKAKVTEIMDHALCPNDIFHDDFDEFLKYRLDILVKKANKLMLM